MRNVSTRGNGIEEQKSSRKSCLKTQTGREGRARGGDEADAAAEGQSGGVEDIPSSSSSTALAQTRRCVTSTKGRGGGGSNTSKNSNIYKKWHTLLRRIVGLFAVTCVILSIIAAGPLAARRLSDVSFLYSGRGGAEGGDTDALVKNNWPPPEVWPPPQRSKWDGSMEGTGVQEEDRIFYQQMMIKERPIITFQDGIWGNASIISAEMFTLMTADVRPSSIEHLPRNFTITRKRRAAPVIVAAANSTNTTTTLAAGANIALLEPPTPLLNLVPFAKHAKNIKIRIGVLTAPSLLYSRLLPILNTSLKYADAVDVFIRRTGVSYAIKNILKAELERCRHPKADAVRVVELDGPPNAHLNETHAQTNSWANFEAVRFWAQEAAEIENLKRKMVRRGTRNHKMKKEINIKEGERRANPKKNEEGDANGAMRCSGVFSRNEGDTEAAVEHHPFSVTSDIWYEDWAPSDSESDPYAAATEAERRSEEEINKVEDGGGGGGGGGVDGKREVRDGERARVGGDNGFGVTSPHFIEGNSWANHMWYGLVDDDGYVFIDNMKMLISAEIDRMLTSQFVTIREKQISKRKTTTTTAKGNREEHGRDPLEGGGGEGGSYAYSSCRREDFALVSDYFVPPHSNVFELNSKSGSFHLYSAAAGSILQPQEQRNSSTSQGGTSCESNSLLKSKEPPSPLLPPLLLGSHMIAASKKRHFVNGGPGLFFNLNALVKVYPFLTPEEEWEVRRSAGRVRRRQRRKKISALMASDSSREGSSAASAEQSLSMKTANCIEGSFEKENQKGGEEKQEDSFPFTLGRNFRPPTTTARGSVCYRRHTLTNGGDTRLSFCLTDGGRWSVPNPNAVIFGGEHLLRIAHREQKQKEEKFDVYLSSRAHQTATDNASGVATIGPMDTIRRTVDRPHFILLNESRLLSPFYPSLRSSEGRAADVLGGGQAVTTKSHFNPQLGGRVRLQEEATAESSSENAPANMNVGERARRPQSVHGGATREHSCIYADETTVKTAQLKQQISESDVLKDTIRKRGKGPAAELIPYKNAYWDTPMRAIGETKVDELSTFPVGFHRLREKGWLFRLFAIEEKRRQLFYEKSKASEGDTDSHDCDDEQSKRASRRTTVNSPKDASSSSSSAYAQLVLPLPLVTWDDIEANFAPDNVRFYPSHFYPRHYENFTMIYFGMTRRQLRSRNKRLKVHRDTDPW